MDGTYELRQAGNMIGIASGEYNLTVAERIKQQRLECEARLKKLNRLSALLEQNQEFEELLNLTRELM